MPGDFNARTGNQKDFIPSIDKLNESEYIDTECNKQGEEFLNFIKDNKLAILSGRLGGSSNKYTCIKNNGSSVVDYIACDYNTLRSCTQMEIFTPNELTYDTVHVSPQVKNVRCQTIRY